MVRATRRHRCQPRADRPRRSVARMSRSRPSASGAQCFSVRRPEDPRWRIPAERVRDCVQLERGPVRRGVLVRRVAAVLERGAQRRRGDGGHVHAEVDAVEERSGHARPIATRAHRAGTRNRPPDCRRGRRGRGSWRRRAGRLPGTRPLLARTAMLMRPVSSGSRRFQRRTRELRASRRGTAHRRARAKSLLAGRRCPRR